MRRVRKGQYGFPVITISPKEYLNKGAEVLLKAMEPVGKAVTKVVAALPSSGPTAMPYFPTTVEEVNRERENLKMREKVFEEDIAPALSPSNHVVAWTQGSMNPKVGQRKIAEWGPLALLASLGADVIGFKYAPKAVKTAPGAAVEAAAKMGSKTAKKTVVAREINRAVKLNTPRATRVRPKNLFRAEVYKGGNVTDPYSNFVTTDSRYASQYGPTTSYIFESKNPAFAREPMMGYRDPVSLDMFIYNNTKANPTADAIIGHDAITGEFPYRSLGVEILNLNPRNLTRATKQGRVISKGTYPWYRGKQYSVKEVVNPDGTVNPRLAMRILHEVSKLFPGSHKMEHRLENPEWHKTDPTTYDHTKNVALSAWGLEVPYGFTKHDLMVAALGHDFGKIVAGDGHAQIGADLARQVFPDLTDAQYTAIAEHMGTPKTSLGKATKAADIDNGRSVGLKYSRDPVYIEGRTMEYPLFVKELGARYKKGGAKIEDYNSSEGILFPVGFTPLFKMWPGKVLRAHGLDIIRRMQSYIDVDKTMGELPIVGKGSVREVVTKNSELPSYMGYFNKPGTLGMYNSRTGRTLVDPSPANKTVSAMQHERNMHGTGMLLTPEMWKPYEDLIKGNFYDNEPTFFTRAFPDGKVRLMTYDKNGMEVAISKGALDKEELRSTLGEYKKQLYERKAYPKAKADNPNVKVEDLEAQRPYYELVVDNLSLSKARDDLKGINSYGRAYAATAHNNKEFLNLLRAILKYSPAVVPFVFPWMVDKKKKGGKTHRPFGHRSILDNGWQSTKLLKNKKNVYGK